MRAKRGKLSLIANMVYICANGRSAARNEGSSINEWKGKTESQYEKSFGAHRTRLRERRKQMSVVNRVAIVEPRPLQFSNHQFRTAVGFVRESILQFEHGPLPGCTESENQDERGAFGVHQVDCM
jgi:hypothetical protein